MSLVVKINDGLIIWNKFMGIIESEIGGISYLLLIFTLWLFITNHIEENQRADASGLNVVYCWIFYCGSFPYSLCLIGENLRQD